MLASKCADVIIIPLQQVQLEHHIQLSNTQLHQSAHLLQPYGVVDTHPKEKILLTLTIPGVYMFTPHLTCAWL